MSSPNLFDYATKELSQDAVICWLLAWAGTPRDEIVGDTEQEELQRCGLRFLRAVLPDVMLGKKVSVSVFHQVKHIDILAIVNQRYVLLLEDKTNTSEHSDQFDRYFNEVKEGNLLKLTGIPKTSEEDIYPVLLKTGNHSLHERNSVEENGYAVFDRSDILRVLQPYRGSNEILLDFRRHLKRWQRETESFRQWTSETVSKNRHDLSWEGLYGWIEEHYQDSGSETWFPLTSMKGGYMGLWMEPEETSENSCFQMWITRNTISFRLLGAKRDISMIGMDREKKKWAQAFVDHGQKILTNPRYGLRVTKSKPMSVSEWRGWLEFDNGGKLDLEKSIRNIDRAKRMLRATIRDGRK